MISSQRIPPLPLARSGTYFMILSFRSTPSRSINRSVIILVMDPSRYCECASTDLVPLVAVGALWWYSHSVPLESARRMEKEVSLVRKPGLNSPATAELRVTVKFLRAVSTTGNLRFFGTLITGPLKGHGTAAAMAGRRAATSESKLRMPFFLFLP